jgi:hypothetical protein
MASKNERCEMGMLAAILLVIYFCAMVWIVPSIIYVCWGIAFFYPPGARGNAAEGVIMMVAFSVGGWLVIKVLYERIDTNLRKKIQTLAPAGFSPEIELFGKTSKQYLGISPSTHGMVIMDPYHKVTNHESMDLLQGYQYEESSKGCYKLTILFNSYVVPSMTFSIYGDRRLNDLIAKLNYSMQGGGRQYGPEVAAESIKAFESLKKKTRIQADADAEANAEANAEAKAAVSIQAFEAAKKRYCLPRLFITNWELLDPARKLGKQSGDNS